MEIKRICDLCGTSITRQLIETGGGASYLEPVEGWIFTLVGGERCPQCPLTPSEQQEEDKFKEL